MGSWQNKFPVEELVREAGVGVERKGSEIGVAVADDEHEFEARRSAVDDEIPSSEYSQSICTNNPAS